MCTHNIWGGTRLNREFGYPIEGDDIGECWGISAHPNGDGTVASGAYKGMKLSELWEKHPELFGNTGMDRFPLLVKIIDAKDDLSIQVHPDDTYAKTKEELERMIHEGRWKEFIREIPIKPGDFIQIDPGTVHAIKGGTLLLETQQSSDITYRVYDYDRLSNGKPRQLHIAQSIDVITVPAKSAENSVVHTEKKDDAIQQLIQCPYYTVYRIDVEHRVETWQDKPFVLMSVVEGEGTLNGTHLKKGDHLILPDGYGKVELQGRMQIIASTI